MAAIAIIISIVLCVVLGSFLRNRTEDNNKLSEVVKRQQEANMELLKRIPILNEGEDGRNEPLTVEKISDALRMEGYFPEVDEEGVRFKIQGESYRIDTGRLPLLFFVKRYSIDPNDIDVDILREAVRLMSDSLIMVKATIRDDEKGISFYVAAQDRNYESFRANVNFYLHILEDSQRKTSEEYHRLMDEKREATLSAQPAFPATKVENKVLS